MGKLSIAIAVCLLVAFSAQATPTGSDGLVAWYQFNEGSGTTSADSCPGDSHPLTLSSEAWTAGHSGHGITSYGSYASKASTPMSTDFEGGALTAAAWFNTNVPLTAAGRTGAGISPCCRAPVLSFASW